MSIYIFTLIMKWVHFQFIFSSFSEVGAQKWFQEFAFFRRITRKYPSWKSGMKQMEKQLKMFHCKNGTMNHSNYSIFFSHAFFPVTSFYSVKWMKHVNFHIRTRRTDERTQNWISVERMKICIFTAGGVIRCYMWKTHFCGFSTYERVPVI